MDRCRRVMGSPGETEDLAQETFLRTFSRIDQYHGGVFVAWL